MQNKIPTIKRAIAQILVIIMLLPLFPTPFEFSLFQTEPAQAANVTIGNEQFTVVIGDLGQIRELRMKNNRTTIPAGTGRDTDPNFMIGNTSSRETSTAHQWTGELIFATRSAATEAELLASTAAFREQDTNRTLANGGSTTTNTIAANNPRFNRVDTNTGANGRGKVEVRFIGLDESPSAGATGITSADARIMRGYDVTSTFDADTPDGSILWSIQIHNKSDQWIEFGDIGMPMSWNTQYNGNTQDVNYTQRVVASAYAGVDSGYAHIKRASGEGNSLIFAPVPQTGARIEYVDQWFRNFQGITGERQNSMFYDWAHDSSNWSTGMAVYYTHSKNINYTGAGYHMDNTSLIIPPRQSGPVYKFKFMPVRAGDNSPGAATGSADLSHPINDNSRRAIETEANLRTNLYNNGMVDAIPAPGYQTAIDMPAKLNLSFDRDIIRNVEPKVMCVHQEVCEHDCTWIAGHVCLPSMSGTAGAANFATCRAAMGDHVHGRDCDFNDPYAGTHIPRLLNGTTHTNWSTTNFRPTAFRQRGYRGLHDYYADIYTKDISLNKDKSPDGFFENARGEWNQVWDIQFGCIGNNSVRVDYELFIGLDDEGKEIWDKKFTQVEFNVLAELGDAAEARAAHQARHQRDTGTRLGLYYDFDLHIGPRTGNSPSNWGDDWSHAHWPMVAQKNLMLPDVEQIRGLERYATWATGSAGIVNMSTGRVNNWIASGTRTYSEWTCAMGFFVMYQIQEAYPELMEYTRHRNWYLEVARLITMNSGMTASNWGKYGEQLGVDIYEAMVRERALDTSSFTNTLITNFLNRHIRDRGRYMATTRYPYISEFPFDNTGEESAYAWAQAYAKYLPDGPNDARVAQAEDKMMLVDLTTRAKRSLANTWFNYGVITFLGGEAWWNFQYTVGYAGSAMDDYLRYQNELNQYTQDERAWANRINYAGKIAHFNSINMGQIVGPRPGTATSNIDNYGALAFRYTMAKGGRGDQNSNGYDGITGNGMARNANFNGWYAFSGEASQGVFASLLRISTDIVTDPLFGTFAYGGIVTECDLAYNVEIRDGFGRRVNFLNEMVYLQMSRNSIQNIEFAKDKQHFDIDLENTTFDQTTNNHTAYITLQGLDAGVNYFVYVDKVPVESSFFVSVAGDNVVGFPVAATSKSFNLTISTNPPAGVIVGIDATGTVNKYIDEPISIVGSVFTQGNVVSTVWTVDEAPEGAVYSFGNAAELATTFTTDAKGSYTLRLTAANDVPEDEDGYALVTFTVADPADYPRPAAAATIEPGLKFVQASYQLTGTGAQSIPGGTISYAWTAEPSEGVAFADAASPSTAVTFEIPGDYVLTFTVTDRLGRTNEIPATVNVTVYSLDALDPPEVTPDWPEIIAIDRPTNLKAVASTNFPGGTLDFEWSVSPVIEGNVLDGADTPTPTITFANFGTYFITVSVTDIAGKTTTVTVPVSVADTAPVVADLTMLRVLHTISEQYDSSQGIVHVQSTDWGASTLTAENASGLVYDYTRAAPVWATVTSGAGTAFGSTGRWTNWAASGVAAARTAAGNVINNPDATNAQIDEAYQNLAGAIESLVPASTPAIAVTNGTAPARDGNIAFVGGRSTSHVSNDSRLHAINRNSNFTGTTLGNTWATHQGWFATTTGHRPTATLGSVWLQYEWPMGAVIEGSSFVFYHHTDGGIRGPASMSYQYMPLDSNVWVPVPGTYPVTPTADTGNFFVAHTFDTPVEARALRANFARQAGGQEPGANEWQVFGSLMPAEAAIPPGADKAELAAAILEFEALLETDYSEGSWAIALAAYDAAMIVFLDGEADQDAADEAEAALLAAIEALEFIRLDNIAQRITFTGDGNTANIPLADFTNGSITSNRAWTDWNRNTAIINGNHVDPPMSNVANNQAWGAWNLTVPVHIILDFGDVYEIVSTGIVWNDNCTALNAAGAVGDGGIKVPTATSWTIEFFNLDTNAWTPVTLLSGFTYGGAVAIDTLNELEFEPVQSDRLRIVFNARNGTGAGTGQGAPGIVEWQVWGREPRDVGVVEANYGAVNAAIAAVEALDRTLYTPESLAALDAAVAAVIPGLPAAQQATVDGFAAAINAAYDALELLPVPADYSAVNEALAAAGAINRTQYTQVSLAILDAAIADVVPGLTAEDQEIVDAFAAAINAAIKGLVDVQPLTLFRFNLNAITRVGRNSELDLSEKINVNANTDFDMAKVTFTVSNTAMATINPEGTKVNTLNRAGTVTLTATYTEGEGTQDARTFRTSITLMIT